MTTLNILNIKSNKGTIASPISAHRSLDLGKENITRAFNQHHHAYLLGQLEGEVSVQQVQGERDAFYIINNIAAYNQFVAKVKELGCNAYSLKARRLLVEEGIKAIVITDAGASALKAVDQTNFYVCSSLVGGTIEFLSTEGLVFSEEAVMDHPELRLALLKEEERKTRLASKATQYTSLQITAQECVYHPEKRVFMATVGREMKVSSTVLIERLAGQGKKVVSLSLLLDRTLGKLGKALAYDKEGTVLFDSFNEIDEETWLPMIPKVKPQTSYLKNEEKNRRHGNRLRAMLMHGVEIEGEKYYPVVQTAAQGRTAKLWLANFDSKEEAELFRQSLTFGAFSRLFKDASTKTVMAKIESRLGLNGSSSKSVEMAEFGEVTFKRVPDAIRQGSFPVKRLDKNYQVIDAVETEINVVDGAGLMSVEINARWELALGNISRIEYDYFMENFTTLKDLQHTTDTRLARIFKRMTNAKMVRRGSNIKGLLVLHDLKAEGVEEDIVLSASMCKEEAGDVVTGGEWRVCNVNDYKWGHIRLSGQMMGALNLSHQDVKSILDENLAGFTTGIFNDYQKALKLVGALASLDGEVSVTTKVAQALATSEDALKDPWIRKKLLELTEKAVMSLKYGELRVAGANYYIVPDPKIFFHALTNGEDSAFNHYTDEDLLQPGTVYCNGWAKEIGAHRSPNCHRSEALISQAVANDDYWYLDNLLILNSFEPLAEAAGGGDKDGDIMAVTDDARIVNKIKRNKASMDYFVLQGLPNPALETGYDLKSIIELYITNSKLSMVGSVSNLAAHAIDYRNHMMIELYRTHKALKVTDAQTEAYRTLALKEQHLLGEMARIDHNTIELSCLIGGAVDAGKTGVQPIIGDHLKECDESGRQLIPAHFFIKQKEEALGRYLSKEEAESLIKQENESGEDKVYYFSESPIGFCYAYVTERMEAIIEALQEEARTQALQLSDAYLARFTEEEINLVQGDIHRYLKDFGARMGELVRYRESFDYLTEEGESFFQDQFAYLIEEYEALMTSVHENQALVAAVLYALVQNQASKSIFAPWGLAFDGMIALLGQGRYNTMVALPKGVTEDDQIMVIRGMIYVNGFMTKETILANGSYEVTMIENRPYIVTTVEGVVECTAKEEVRRFTSSSEVYSVKATGFKYNASQDALGFYELLKANDWTFEIRSSANGRSMIYVDGCNQPIAAYQMNRDNQDLTLVKRHQNKRCRLPQALTNDSSVNGIYRLNKQNEVVLSGAVWLTFEIIGEAQAPAVQVVREEVAYNAVLTASEASSMTSCEIVAQDAYNALDEQEMALLAAYEYQAQDEREYAYFA